MKYELPTLDDAQTILRHCERSGHDAAQTALTIKRFMSGRAIEYYRERLAEGASEMQAYGEVMTHIGHLCLELDGLKS